MPNTPTPSRGIATLPVLAIVLLVALLASAVTYVATRETTTANTAARAGNIDAGVTNTMATTNTANTNGANASGNTNNNVVGPSFQGQDPLTRGFTDNLVTIDGQNARLEFVSPDGAPSGVPDSIWYRLDVSTSYGKTGVADGQHLTNNVMPEYPAGGGIIYLATTDFAASDRSRATNRVYSYDTTTTTLTEIYTERAEANSPFGGTAARTLRMTGIDGSRLILQLDDYDNSPGPCTRPWYHYKDKLVYLDLTAPSALGTYVVPVSLVESDRIAAENCLRDLDPGR